MRTTNEKIARDWLQSPRFSGWQLGMMDATSGGEICCGFREDNGYPIFSGPESAQFDLWERCPDLDHPGTRAFLLEDVRKAWGCCVVTHPPCTLRPRLWSCEAECVDAGVVYWQRFQARTEAAALIAALEAAP